MSPSGIVVCGLDPGPSTHGFCVLAIAPGKRPEWLDGGHANLDTIRAVVGERMVDAIAVERPHGHVHQHARGAALIDTAFAAGAMAAHFEAKGLAVYLLSPEEARLTTTGKRTPSDAEVKQALANRLTLPTRSSAHARDACVVAYAVAVRQGWLVGGRGRLPVPPTAPARRTG